MTAIVYGPVSSWRLGRSLGIDLLASDSKLCSFDCVYCQLGDTLRPLARRRQFVTAERLAQELEAIGPVSVDHATFSGMGEPTLASNLGEAIDLVRSLLGVPVAVLTNSSLMPREDVRRDLARADVVVAKLDAPDEALFRRVDRPRMRCSLSAILEAIRLFREGYRGRLALQMMFIQANRQAASRMASLAAQLSPDEVQINTPLRPGGAGPLPPEEIAAIRDQFSPLDGVVSVYDAQRPVVAALDPLETAHRRSRPTPEEEGGAA